MLSRVFTSSALLREPSKVAHELNAIGLCANDASILGVNPMFLVNTSRVGFESAGTCSGFGTAVLDIRISVSYSFGKSGKADVGSVPRLLRAWVSVEAGQAFHWDITYAAYRLT